MGTRWWKLGIVASLAVTAAGTAAVIHGSCTSAHGWAPIGIVAVLAGCCGLAESVEAWLRENDWLEDRP